MSAAACADMGQPRRLLQSRERKWQKARQTFQARRRNPFPHPADSQNRTSNGRTHRNCQDTAVAKTANASPFFHPQEAPTHRPHNCVPAARQILRTLSRIRHAHSANAAPRHTSVRPRLPRFCRPRKNCSTTAPDMPDRDAVLPHLPTDFSSPTHERSRAS